MLKNILVSLTGFESDAIALETAYLIGRLFDARLDCICARPSLSQIAIGASPFEVGAAMNAAELIADLQAENELRTIMPALPSTRSAAAGASPPPPARKTAFPPRGARSPATRSKQRSQKRGLTISSSWAVRRTAARYPPAAWEQ
jgi:hypothetical protein